MIDYTHPDYWQTAIITLRQSGLRQAEIARIVGCGRASVTRWAKGVEKPNTTHAFALQALIEARANVSVPQREKA